MFTESLASFSFENKNMGIDIFQTENDSSIPGSDTDGRMTCRILEPRSTEQNQQQSCYTYPYSFTTAAESSSMQIPAAPYSVSLAHRQDPQLNGSSSSGYYSTSSSAWTTTTRSTTLMSVNPGSYSHVSGFNDNGDGDGGDGYGRRTSCGGNHSKRPRITFSNKQIVELEKEFHFNK